MDNLFDIIDKQEVKEKLIICKHLKEEKTETLWPGDTTERMTWTCIICGRIRGRCTG